MKLAKLIAAFAALLVLPGIMQAAATAQSGASKITVTYADWQKFTDIKDRFDFTEAGELGILKELEASLQRDAKFYVPDGDHLSVVFTDIRLAGDFEPERGPQWDDVRIVKDIYPPRFVFAYTLTDSAGKVIKSGSEHLTDLNFQMHISIDRDDPLHYEKDMLNTWMDSKIHH